MHHIQPPLASHHSGPLLLKALFSQGPPWVHCGDGRRTQDTALMMCSRNAGVVLRGLIWLTDKQTNIVVLHLFLSKPKGGSGLMWLQQRWDFSVCAPSHCPMTECTRALGSSRFWSWVKSSWERQNKNLSRVKWWIISLIELFTYLDAFYLLLSICFHIFTLWI